MSPEWVPDDDDDWPTYDEETPASLPELPPLPDLITERERREFNALLTEKLERAKEALRLYEPYPDQDGFHRSKATYRLARGGNRGGKTLVTCTELARAITRQDPYKKWPKSGRFIVVGRDLEHCSKVIYRKLFKPGAIKICWDKNLCRWRSWRPDLDKEEAAVPAPPLVPRRFYSPKMISWENRREEIPRTIRLHTDWELTFFSGKGEPPQGWDVDGILFDEEIEHAGWFQEMVPRLVDRRGRLMWSATPQVGTIQLYELSERAASLVGTPNPRVTEHFYTIRGNPFFTEQQKADFESDFEDDEEQYQVRVLGNFALRGMRVYAEFSPRGVHRVDAFPIPDNWCRYVAIDPGRQVAAALFIAVPPAHSGYTQPIVYDELYIRKCNAKMFAEIMSAKIGEQWIHGWLIDHHEGQKHDTGSGRTVEAQYAAELRTLKCDERNGFKGFIWASDDVDAGLLAAKSKLHLREGMTEWQFMTEKLKFFCWEIERYTDRKIASSGVVTEQPVKKNDHLMDCFRYLALHRLKYVTPPKKVKAKTQNKYLEAKKKRQRDNSGWGESIRL